MKKHPLGLRGIFDSAWAESEKIAAIERVGAGRPAWVATALYVGFHVAIKQPELTADDLWRELIVYLGERRALVDEPRALGNVMTGMAHDGVIVKTERWVKSERVACHGRPIAVWRSLVYPIYHPIVRAAAALR